VVAVVLVRDGKSVRENVTFVVAMCVGNSVSRLPIDFMVTSSSTSMLDDSSSLEDDADTVLGELPLSEEELEDEDEDELRFDEFEVLVDGLLVSCMLEVATSTAWFFERRRDCFFKTRYGFCRGTPRMFGCLVVSSWAVVAERFELLRTAPEASPQIAGFEAFGVSCFFVVLGS
jgi:hypothetical protein